MNLPRLTDLDPPGGEASFMGKSVIVRADLDCDSFQTTDYRLQNLLPTLNYLMERKAKIIIIGHRGRPTPFNLKSPMTDNLSEVMEFGLAPVAKLLEKELGKTVGFIPDIRIKTLSDNNRNIPIMLENLRFEEGEEKNDQKFAEDLANLADIYVNEAFASSHREHTSVNALPKLMKLQGKQICLGLRFMEEIENLSKVFVNAKKPVVTIISGLKEDKLSYVEPFLEFSDKILIGGILPEYFEKFAISNSQLAIKDKIFVAQLLPDKEDITINSIERFEKEIENAGTIVVSGPLGKFEDEGHRQGTQRIFEAVVTNKNAFKVAGGGDTEKAISLFAISDKFSWISTGGGAMLDFLAKGTLPGIEASS
jgi:phosphoglycerate kinase